jgi:hypothetical protein
MHDVCMYIVVNKLFIILYMYQYLFSYSTDIQHKVFFPKLFRKTHNEYSTIFLSSH